MVLEDVDHTVWLQVEESNDVSKSTDELTLDFTTRFVVSENGLLEPFEDLRLLLHDLALGDYQTNGVPPEQREKTMADLPFPGVVLIETERVYRGRTLAGYRSCDPCVEPIRPTARR